MIIRSKCPLRVSFAGGGLDFPHYFENNEPGIVLSSTIKKYAYATLYPRDDDQIIIRSINLGIETSLLVGKPFKMDGALDLCKAAVHRLGCNKGMELEIRSDVLPGSGLGGSSSIVSAIMGAVIEYCGIKMNPYEIAELNYQIERVDVGIPGGKQDQFATAFGGFKTIEFFKDRTIVNQLAIDSNIINDFESHLLFCYTGGVRTDLNMITKQIQHHTAIGVDEAMENLKKITYTMKENLQTGKLDNFGELLDAAYRNKKKMNPDLTTGSNVDQLYEMALENGALGGKLCGAGGGGYLVLYVPTSKQQQVKESLERVGGTFHNIMFEEKGIQTWTSNCA